MNNYDNNCFQKIKSDCEICQIKYKLNCHFKLSKLLSFIILFMIFALPVIIGIILAGYGLYLIGWFIFFVIFFEFWEIRILCSHCPFYAEKGRILHCIANYGSLKIWKYHPEPINRREKIQLFIGLIILFGYPLLFLLIGKQYLFLILSLIGLSFFITVLLIKKCSKCVNLSCPLNRVPREIKIQYLKQNPIMYEAWKNSGYNLE